MTKKEFERLQPGQLIQSKKDNKWAFIVHQNFGDRITCARIIEVREPEEWEVVTEVKVVEEVAEKIRTEDKINAAAASLYESLKNEPWFRMIGMGDKELIVYTKIKKCPKLVKRCDGFPIVYKYIGEISSTDE